MTTYTEYKKRSFKTRDEADKWAKEEKKRFKPFGVLKINIDRTSNTPEGLNWRVVLLRRME